MDIGGCTLHGSELALWAANDWAVDLLLLLSVPALVLLNGFFVAAEFSLVAVRRTQVEEMIRQGKRGAETLQNEILHLDRSIAATQLGITIASIALGWVGEPALAHLIEPLFTWVAPDWRGPAVHTTAITLAFLLITFLHVVLGELAPKAMALQKPATIALWVAVPLAIFTRITRPIVVSMNGVGNWIVRLLGFRAIRGEQMVHSVEELAMLVEEVEEAGLLSADQAEYVQNVFTLARKRVQDCMVPREKMAALELLTPPERILEIARQGAHTRMPVYDGEPDNIVGIVNTKDLFYLFSLQGVVVLQDAIYPALFLKPDQPIADALRLFRRAHRPMAVVRTEEGRVQGLITLEDILEEIVGDIEDEHDRPGSRVRLDEARRGPAAAAAKKPEAGVAPPASRRNDGLGGPRS
jgi:CBS domain containing-hemolysin-like protein